MTGPGRSPRHDRLLGGVLALAVATSACGLTGNGEEHHVDATPRGSIPWTDCGDGLLCGEITVPVDHARPNGATLDLALAVRPAADRDDRLGVVLTNPGGPGASGIATLRAGLPLSDDSLERFDVIAWDPRGAGDSGALSCPGFEAMLDLDPDPEAEDRTILDGSAPTVARRCASSDAELLEHMSTADQVGDMEAIRVATGEDQIGFVGFSYGTRLGLAYLDRYGDRVSAMVLDSVVPPDLSVDELLLGQAESIQGLLDDRGADATSAIGSVRTAAAAGTVDGPDGPLAPVRVDRAAVSSTYGTTQSDRFIEALTAAEEGDGRGLDALAGDYLDLVDLGAYLAISCADGDGPRGAAGWDRLERRAIERAPTVGAVTVNELRPCAFWPRDAVTAVTAVPDAPADSGRVPAPPVLLINNTDDPATPVIWARTVAAILADAALVEIGATGHIATDGSACAADLAARTLVDLALPSDPSCR